MGPQRQKHLTKQQKRGQQRKNTHHIKELGRWKPIDDLALINGVLQTNDLKVVHRGVKFSCKFTLSDVQQRWNTLMFDESISRLAIAAMQNLHPEMVQVVESKALFSAAEEELLSTIKSTENPSLAEFEDLLQKHAGTFFVSRSPRTLFQHWQLLKQYSLLPDQTVQPLPRGDTPIMSFSDAEEQIIDSELAEHPDENLELELTLADRRAKQEIRQVENELSRWSVLVESLGSSGSSVIPSGFDSQTLAVIRGRLVRFLMRSREITVGRSTKDNTVDVDLSLEGPSIKVSRKQGTIKLRSNGDFFISNDGKHPIFVNGVPILTESKARLNNNAVLEVAGLKFVFLINYDLINAIRVESAQHSHQLNNFFE